VKAFLQGYQKGRNLSRVEYEAIFYFELVSVIWVMSIHAKNANRIGYKFLEKTYWDRRLQILRELEAQQGAAPDSGDAPRPFAGER
jgi:Ser/Thr protein kinase RdoA (MazF antagonist)